MSQAPEILDPFLHFLFHYTLLAGKGQHPLFSTQSSCALLMIGQLNFTHKCNTISLEILVYTINRGALYVLLTFSFENILSTYFLNNFFTVLVMESYMITHFFFFLDKVRILFVAYVASSNILTNHTHTVVESDLPSFGLLNQGMLFVRCLTVAY